MSTDKVALLRRRIDDLRQLPTLPTIATQVMRLVRSPNSSMGAIAEVVASDPALAAKVLKVANSAFYGLRERVTSLQLALAVLGMNEINNIVVSVSVVTAFPETPGTTSFDRERFWEHCAACAQVAKLLADQLDLDVSGEAFVGGLTHDIGRIVLDQYFHSDFTEALRLSAEAPMPITEAEQQVLGANHAEIGSWVAQRWGLPKAIIEIIAAHHEPEKAQTYTVLADLVYLANVLTQPIEHPDQMTTSAAIDTAMASAAWSRLAERSARFGRQDASGLTELLEAELPKAHELVRISQAGEKTAA